MVLAALNLTPSEKLVHKEKVNFVQFAHFEPSGEIKEVSDILKFPDSVSHLHR